MLDMRMAAQREVERVVKSATSTVARTAIKWVAQKALPKAYSMDKN